MKKQILGMILALFASKCFGAVTGEGNVEFVFSEGTQIKNIRYDYSENYFGTFSRFNSSSNTWIYPWNPYGDVFLDQNYEGSVTDQLSSLNASWSPTDGSVSFDFISDSTDPGNINENIFTDLCAVITLGPYIELPSFSYHYNFTGLINTSEDTLEFSVQTEIGYGSTVFYTDYNKYDPSYRTNWVFLNLADENGLINQSGNIFFPSYSSTDGTQKDWFIRYNVTSNGYDSGGSPVPVPEPSIFLLYVLGITFGLWKLKQK